MYRFVTAILALLCSVIVSIDGSRATANCMCAAFFAVVRIRGYRSRKNRDNGFVPAVMVNHRFEVFVATFA